MWIDLRVTSDIVGTDTQVSDLEPRYTVHIQTLVQNTVLDDAVTLSGSHGAGLSK
jgi:hypothetical protein